jgi:hypothetical protein
MIEEEEPPPPSQLAGEEKRGEGEEGGPIWGLEGGAAAYLLSTAPYWVWLGPDEEFCSCNGPPDLEGGKPLACDCVPP